MSETKGNVQLVVVGSSAGGIEALSKLVASLPVPFMAPLVIAQHLDPKRISHLADILRHHTSLKVVSVEREELLKPGTIYVVPSNHHVEITDYDVKLLPDGDGRPTPSVNLLLSSAAKVYKENLIAVILTGTGSDGTVGAQSVHEHGGKVIIQNPATAAYPGMPQSLDSSTVDFVADLDDIGAILADLVSGKVPIAPNMNVFPDKLKPLLTQVRNHTEIDFSIYKPTTILRRLERRLEATGSKELKDYSNYLDANPDEYELLVADLLIKVTEFMRDPELFTYLREQVLPELIEYSRFSEKNELRFWSAGCATGEEAYSLAILLAELLGEELSQFNIKIFATDLDSDAITFARRGFYTIKSLARLPQELVTRYFLPNPNGLGYEIKKQIRNLVVFGEQDLGKRAPFPRIDMVLCRNVLIYFNREMQEHALKLFAFALRDEGYLVLGRTETVSPLGAFFDVVEPQQRVYRRQGERRLIPPFSLKDVKSTLQPKTLPKQPTNSDQKVGQPVVERNLFQMQEEARHNHLSRDNLLLNLPVGVVVVDSHFDIIEINAAARRLLSIHTVAIGEDFVHLAKNIPPHELSEAITGAIRENTISTLNPVEVPHLTTGEATFLQLSCYPQPATQPVELTPGSSRKNERQQPVVLIIIADQTHEVTAQRQQKKALIEQAELVEKLNQRILGLEHATTDLQKVNNGLNQANVDLLEERTSSLHVITRKFEQGKTELATAKKEHSEIAQARSNQMEGLIKANHGLLDVNEDITTQNAVLRANNEEFLLYREEAQAAIEEADTLNEEMQATNEELETLTEELQASIEELNTTNSDLVVQSQALHEMAGELRIEQQHSEREKSQLAAILASMADALVVVDNNQEILLTNAAYQALQGTAEKPVLLDEDGLKPLMPEATPLARAAKGETFNLTFNYRDLEGHRHWLEASGQPVHGEDMEDRSVVVMRDITDRSLRRLQEQFLSMISHELRSPLTIIKGYSHMIERWFDKQAGDFEKPVSHLAQILSNVNILQQMIEDLVDVNRLQNGKFKINFGLVQLDTLLARVVETCQPFTAIPLEIVVGNAGDAEPFWVRGDARRIQQVITNLINNATTHASTSPKLCLSLSRVAASGGNDKGLVELRVQDFGEGIKAEHLVDIFDQFYQVLDGESTSHGGVGLGLFICEQIVLAHGGTIRVESIEGQGATFIIQLPLVEAEGLALPS